MTLTNEEIMQINQTAEFDSAIGYARKIEEAVIESYKAELLKEVGEPEGTVISWNPIEGLVTVQQHHKTNGFPDPRIGSSRYTSDQWAAAILRATKPLGEEIERLNDVEQTRIRNMNIDFDELRAQLAAAQEEIADLKKTIKARDFEVETLYVRRGENEELKDQLAKAEQRVAEWQPIETAPKDGPSLLWVDTDDGGEPMVLYRDSKGRWLYEGEPTFCQAFYLEPTHWMPLPKAPANGASS